MKQHEHKWSAWEQKQQYVNYSDGMYLETWYVRWCFTCGAEERSNYSRSKVNKG